MVKKGLHWGPHYNHYILALIANTRWTEIYLRAISKPHPPYFCHSQILHTLMNDYPIESLSVSHVTISLANMKITWNKTMLSAEILFKSNMIKSVQISFVQMQYDFWTIIHVLNIPLWIQGWDNPTDSTEFSLSNFQGNPQKPGPWASEKTKVTH